jgi:D-3-phosphoglycerate dehydrogenase
MTVGLVGFGRIAQRVAATLAQLGGTVIACDPYVTEPAAASELVDLPELLQQSDAVLLHAPLTPETAGMIRAAELRLMPGHSVLVNTSRGGLVVLDDLLEHLRSGGIAGAALDVFDVEPVDPARFEHVPGLILSPHMSYYSEEALEESQTKATRQVVKVLTGEPPDYPVRAGSWR